MPEIRPATSVKRISPLRLLRRLLLGGMAGFLAGALILSVMAWMQWGAAAVPPVGSPTERQVWIEPGSTLPDVVVVLSREGLLEKPLVFRIGARLSGLDKRLRAGRYSIPTTASPREILAILVAGRTIPVKVILREGLIVEEMAEAVGAALGFSPEAFLEASDSLVRRRLLEGNWLGSEAAFQARDGLTQELRTSQPHALHWSEGYLAPDTYHFAEGTSVATAAQVIVTLGMARIDSAWSSATPRVRRLLPARHDLVTLASIVEAEARLVEEQKRIAAVYVNRLDRKWRLEADPCVAWLLDKRGERILYRDLEHDSPYNTYRHRGLPPGPIGNPGLGSLQAVARPAEGFAAVFFVADGSGGHVFSETSAQHQEAVARYRQLRRSGRLD